MLFLQHHHSVNLCLCYHSDCSSNICSPDHGTACHHGYIGQLATVPAPQRLLLPAGGSLASAVLLLPGYLVAPANMLDCSHLYQLTAQPTGSSPLPVFCQYLSSSLSTQLFSVPLPPPPSIPFPPLLPNLLLSCPNKSTAPSLSPTVRDPGLNRPSSLPSADSAYKPGLLIDCRLLPAHSQTLQQAWLLSSISYLWLWPWS